MAVTGCKFFLILMMVFLLLNGKYDIETKNNDNALLEEKQHKVLCEEKTDKKDILSVGRTEIKSVDENFGTLSSNSSGSTEEDYNEKWYDIGTNLPQVIDYSGTDMLRFIRSGDIVYEPTGGFGITGHVAIVEGVFYDSIYQQYYIRLIEAVEFGVTYGLMTPSRFNGKHAEIYRVRGATKTNIDNALAFAKSQLGKKYAISGGKDSSGDNHDWYCSELVWASYYHQEIYFDYKTDKFAIFPMDIANSSATKIIMDYKTVTETMVIDNNTHRIICNEVETVGNHEFAIVSSCYLKCNVCNFTYQTKNHDYTYSYQNMGVNHKAYCACGDTKLFENAKYLVDGVTKCYNCDWSSTDHVHLYNDSFYSNNDGKSHYAGCACGAGITQKCFGFTGSDGVGYCDRCGQRLKQGQIFFSTYNELEIFALRFPISQNEIVLDHALVLPIDKKRKSIFYG